MAHREQRAQNRGADLQGAKETHGNKGENIIDFTAPLYVVNDSLSHSFCSPRFLGEPSSCA